MRAARGVGGGDAGGEGPPSLPPEALALVDGVLRKARGPLP